MQLLDKNKDYITNFEIMSHFRNPRKILSLSLSQNLPFTDVIIEEAGHDGDCNGPPSGIDNLTNAVIL